MRTQDGIMYPHLFKNPQRVQNMRDELFSDVRTFLEVCRCAGEWLSSMWDSWQYLLLSEEEPEIRELFDRPRLPMINLYHFRWWPDLLDGCWPRGPHWYSLKSSQLVPSVCLTPVTFHRIAAMKQNLFESCWGDGGTVGKMLKREKNKTKQSMRMRANVIPDISAEWHNSSSSRVSQRTRDELQRKTPQPLKQTLWLSFINLLDVDL